jgi:hypothetical protein
MTQPTHHTIRWTLGSYGRLSGSGLCTAPEGAGCRLIGGPDCQCEEWDPLRDEQGKPYHLANEDASPERHYMHDQGECNIGLFLENGDIEECGPGHEVVIGELPIEPEWDGDGYTWKPAEART